jgi:endoglycosylceramidase
VIWSRWALVAMFAAACGDDRAAGCHDASSVCGGRLRDADGRVLVMRGVNLAGAHKLPPHTDDFTFADYERLHAWGFRSLRFLITWAAIEPTPGSYDDAYLDWVGERMQWARDAGLSVVLDMHQDVYGEGFGFGGAPRWTCPEAYYAAFVPNDNWILNYSDANVLACYDNLWTDESLHVAYAAMWGYVAARLAAEPAILGIDPMNEPHWGTYAVTTFEVERLQPVYTRVIDAVRANAPGWLVFAEPSSSRNLGFASRLAPFDAPGVVYAPHMYDQTAELSGQFDAARRESLLANAMDLQADAERLGLPLWIGEYGGIGTSPAIGAYMDAAYDGAATAFASSMYWAFDRGGGYAMLDADGNEVVPLLDAIVRPYAERIAGEPLATDYDETTRTLRVTWRPDGSIHAPTVIVAPARVYPDGFAVACEDCTAVEDGDEVHVTSGSAQATVMISPR